MVDNCSREIEVLCTVTRSWLLSFTTRVNGKILSQILLEVLMNCTKHFDLNSSLTVSCVARFMICWVCQLYFSGLVCSVLSLDEYLIEINCGPFCVAPRTLSHLVWHRVWMICNVKSYFYWTTIFLRKMAEFSLRWFGCSIKRLIFQFWVSFGSVVEFSLIRGKITAGASVFNWHIYLVNWQTYSSSFGFLSSGARTSRSINWGWMYLRFIFCERVF